MKTLAELTLRVADLETRLENMLQLAKVLKLDDADESARHRDSGRGTEGCAVSDIAGW